MSAANLGATEPTRPLALIIGINYAPEHAGIGPYTTALAEGLVAAGYTVDVMTGLPHYPSWRVPKGYGLRFRFTETTGELRVRRHRHYIPTAQSALRRIAYEGTFALNVAMHRYAPAPELVVAVVPSLISAFVASRIAAQSDARFVVWIQDSMSAAARQSGVPGGNRIAGLVGALESRVLACASSIVVVSPAFVDHVITSGAKPERIHTFPNWTHIAIPSTDRAEVRKTLRWGDDEIIALHAGNMGLKQGLEGILKVAQTAVDTRSSVRFVLLGDGSQRKYLERKAFNLPNVRFLDPVPDSQFADILAAADVLLVHEARDVRDMSLPSKLTSYQVAGTPIVAAVRLDGSTAQEVRRLGGVVVDSSDPLALVTACADAAASKRKSEPVAFVPADHRVRQLVALVAGIRRPPETEDQLGF